MKMDWPWMLIQSELPGLTTCHSHKGHNSLPEKGTMPQRGHRAGYSGIYVLGNTAN